MNDVETWQQRHPEQAARFERRVRDLTRKGRPPTDSELFGILRYTCGIVRTDGGKDLQGAKAFALTRGTEVVLDELRKRRRR